MNKFVLIGVIFVLSAGVTRAQIVTSKASLDTSTQKKKTVTTVKVEGTVSLREDQSFTKVVAVLGTLNNGKFVELDPAVKLDAKPELTKNEGKYDFHFKKTPLNAGKYTVKITIEFVGADGDDYSSQPSYETVTVP